MDARARPDSARITLRGDASVLSRLQDSSISAATLLGSGVSAAATLRGKPDAVAAAASAITRLGGDAVRVETMKSVTTRIGGLRSAVARLGDREDSLAVQLHGPADVVTKGLDELAPQFGSGLVLESVQLKLGGGGAR